MEFICKIGKQIKTNCNFSLFLPYNWKNVENQNIGYVIVKHSFFSPSNRKRIFFVIIYRNFYNQQIMDVH
jgi:hypothetical protein